VRFLCFIKPSKARIINHLRFGVCTMIEAEILNQIEAKLADLASRGADIRGYL
jgi:hypothetical protein